MSNPTSGPNRPHRAIPEIVPQRMPPAQNPQSPPKPIHNPVPEKLDEIIRLLKKIAGES